MNRVKYVHNIALLKWRW